MRRGVAWGWARVSVNLAATEPPIVANLLDSPKWRPESRST